MRLTIDTVNKTVQINESIQIQELIEQLMNLNIGNDYTLVVPTYPIYTYNGDNCKPRFPEWYTSSKI